MSKKLASIILFPFSNSVLFYYFIQSFRAAMKENKIQN
jgi:hypothetical protein